MKVSSIGFYSLVLAFLLTACPSEVSGPNQQPVAVAGGDQKVQVGQTATLDGSGSYDPDGVVQGYFWQLVAAPSEHNGDLVDPTKTISILTPDKPGIWVVRLEVSDGELRSEPDVVRILCESCIVNENCNDQNPCTTDLCQEGACKNQPVTTVTSCNDNLFCTEVDTCLAGTCVGSVRSCDDSNPCTQDVCDENQGMCRNNPLGIIPEAEGPAGTCNDGKDNDCDGQTDGNDPDCCTNPTDWWNNDWHARRKLTFDNSEQTSALSEFPVLVVFNTSRINYDNLKTDGTDLRFIASDKTELTYHIEDFVWGGTSYIWVKVPSIAANSNTDFIWMYYHNTTASSVQNPASETYDSNFVGVWHLNEIVTGGTSTGIHADSTSRSNNGTQVNNDDTPGKIARGQIFDAAGDYIQITTHDTSLDLTTTWTIETWVNASRAPFDDWQALISKDVNANTPPVNRSASLWLYGDLYNSLPVNKVQVWFSPVDNGPALESNSNLSIGIWYYLTTTFNNGTLTLYINGNEDGSITQSTPSANKNSLYFGQRGQNTGGHYWFSGSMDEVRISNSARGAAWIKAQYLSMTDQFISFKPEEVNCN
jgi:hypothetical protein